jgi:hypothetical protein
MVWRMTGCNSATIARNDPSTEIILNPFGRNMASVTPAFSKLGHKPDISINKLHDEAHMGDRSKNNEASHRRMNNSAARYTWATEQKGSQLHGTALRAVESGRANASLVFVHALTRLHTIAHATVHTIAHRNTD